MYFNMVNEFLINLLCILLGLFVSETIFIVIRFKKHEEAIYLLAEEIDDLRNERNK